MRPLRRPPTDLPLGFAHRGARAECRDNTLDSFARALELGARGLESDVWVTSDGVVVLDHDGVVRRGLRRVAIRDVRRDALPGHIPSLEELLEASDASIDVSLDVKDPAAAGPTIDLVEAAGRAERVWLCGSGSLLPQWRGQSPLVRLVDSTRLARIPEGLAERAARLRVEGVDAVNLRWPEWTRERIDVVHAAGLLAFAWDAQRTTTIATLVELGVDGVYSDHVGRLGEVLAAHRGEVSGTR